MQCGVVTTCGVTSIRQSPGDPRVPVSQCRLQVRLLSRLVVVLSAVLQDEAMAGLLAKCGATNSFTLVRYSPPHLLASYSRSPPQVATLRSSPAAYRLLGPGVAGVRGRGGDGRGDPAGVVRAAGVGAPGGELAQGRVH